MPSKSTCSFPGCPNGGRIKAGLCNAHYHQKRRGLQLSPVREPRRKCGTPPRIICDEMMCPFPGLIGPCHVFRGKKNEGGYGRLPGGGLVHAYIWEKENGPIEDKLVLDHQCRVHACCNTDHLRPVTRKVNSTENVIGSKWQLNAAKTHCMRGHPFNEQNTDRRGNHRRCKECRRLKLVGVPLRSNE